MTYRNFLKAALLGVTVAVTPILGSHLVAETLRVVRNGTDARLGVPMNRAVVVESDTPFAELSIANPAIADISSLSDRTIYVLGKSPGATTLTLLDASGRLITNVEVRVSADVTEFKERLKQILPGEKIEVRTANDGIVLSGTASSPQKMQRALDLAARYAPERVSNLMTVGGVQQVMLKVRFAEMQRNVSKALSASLNGTIDGNGLSTGTFLSAGNAQALIDGDPIAVSPGTLGAFNFGINSGAVNLSVLLEALESRGMTRSLAEPNLIALSGQQATFHAGGEYPVPVAQEDSTITVEFKPFGVSLQFVPRVVDGDLINLELNTEVSGIDAANGFTNGNFTISAFTSRKASTTVELRDGQSFAIAGLLEDDFRDVNAQVPWLGDIPVLGALFRSADYNRSQSELVIVITAHLVSPTRGEAIALPTDRVMPPSEKDLFLFGEISKGNRPQKGAAGEVAKQDFSGSYGYVLD
ncbi:type II and III secretion system protein family protein [Cognatishimia activa]|uniref:Pectic enzymes secretion protein OutD n=1 Tax=Cognatishimia activa TaxID=1715691 RepID=A0A0P1IS85_9RHOB|nr:type II and III secretion system protein family protein [Cognatishimia activa]CUI64945.1 Pectic enzymes secretion protein OutD [Cognatishimia activa]CUK26406.1 Pectic enzymes secretion protein OutD [Cognatishimia activa]